MKLRNSLFLIVLLGLLVTTPSCEKDETEPSPTGDDRDKFVGTWKCQETSSQTGTNIVFNVSISKSGSAAKDIFIDNFYNFGSGQKARAVINGSSASIPSQNISGNTVSGNGTIQGSTTINMNYTVFDGSSTDTVSATLTKQ